MKKVLIKISNLEINGQRGLRRVRVFYWLLHFIIRVCFKVGVFEIMFNGAHFKGLKFNRKYRLDRVFIDDITKKK